MHVFFISKNNIMFLYNINYINLDIHVNIFKLFTVCVYLYIHNKYTLYTYSVKKTVILYTINRGLTSLINIFISVSLELSVSKYVNRFELYLV